MQSPFLLLLSVSFCKIQSLSEMSARDCFYSVSKVFFFVGIQKRKYWKQIKPAAIPSRAEVKQEKTDVFEPTETQ